MYPTLNMSLLAQPTAAPGADSEVTPLLEGAELDLAETFQASLARSLGPAGEGGKPLPLDGTTLPESGLAVAAELADSLPAESPGAELALPGIIVPDTMEVDIAVADTPLQTGSDADSPVRAILPVTLPAQATSAAAEVLAEDVAADNARPVPLLPGASAARRALTTDQPLPRPDDTASSKPDRMPMMPVDTRMGREVTARAEEAAKVAVQGGLEAREVSAQRAEFAVNMAETQAQRVAEQRSVTTGSLPPLEPGTVLASPTRPTINIATPVQGPALQSGPVDAPIRTPVGEPGFDDAVADRVWVMTQARLSNAEIRLTPAELGPVRIQVAVDDGTANVSFQAAQAATREAIEQALPRLRELLAENGLSLGQASVGEDGVRDGHRETPERAAGAAGVDESGEDLDSEAVMADSPRRSGSARSLVDTFA